MTDGFSFVQFNMPLLYMLFTSALAVAVVIVGQSRAYSLYSPRYYITIQHGNYVCAWAEARSHDLLIESRSLFNLS